MSRRTEEIILAIDELHGSAFTMNTFPGISRVQMNSVIQPLRMLGFIKKLDKTHYQSLVPSLAAEHQAGKMEGMFSAYNRKVKGTGTPRTQPAGALPPTSEPIVQTAPTPAATAMDMLQQQLAQVTALPDIVIAMLETVTELLSTDYSDLLNLLESKIEQAESLKGLLGLSKRDASTQRARIEELRTKLAQLQAQRNRVVPETKILVRDPINGGHWGNGH